MQYYLALFFLTWADQEGGAEGPDTAPPPPPKNLKKNIGILRKTCLDPLENHKATMLAFNVYESLMCLSKKTL